VSLRREPWELEIDGIPINLPIYQGGALSNRLTFADEGTIVDLAKYDLQITTTLLNPTIIDQACNLFQVAPGLESVIRRCVKEIIILKAPSDAFDVSHSEPRWPTRIFVSIPSSSTVVNLRVAEAIVHEAMHLNLTFLERQKPLISSAKKLYSPWRDEPRPISGVVHGLYVFACIHRFFEYLLVKTLLDCGSSEHIKRRLSEIKDEFRVVDYAALLDFLAPPGVSFTRALFGLVLH